MDGHRLIFLVPAGRIRKGGYDMKHFHIGWILYLVILGLCVPAKGFAMIQTLSLEKLVGSSDLIVITTLRSSRVLEKDATGFLRVEKVMIVEKVLKGSAEAGKDLKVETIDGFEDSPMIPEGEKVILFLQKKAAGIYKVNNLIQGAWPLLENEECGGMGFGQTLNSLKELIKEKPKAPREKKGNHGFN